MSAPYISRSPSHDYTFDGKTYPGVTGVLKVIDKSDALMGWASRMTAEAAIRLGDALPTLIAQVGAEGAVKALTARSSWQRDQAAAKGTEFHALADTIHRGDPLPAFELMEGSTVNRLNAYLSWWGDAGWRLRAAEAMVIRPGPHGYGGTFDLLAYDEKGRTVLADIKTGTPYREATLQLAAYGDATYMDPGDGTLYEMPKVDRYAVIHVPESGPVRIIDLTVGADERRAFRACRVLYDWHTATKAVRL